MTEKFRPIGIINGWDFAGGDGGGVRIVYRPSTSGRAYLCAAWQVAKDGFKTDPDAHWRDYYAKTFDVHRKEEKAGQLEEAKRWAGERFKITRWAKTPFGDWMDADFVAKRMKELRDQLRKAGGK